MKESAKTESVKHHTPECILVRGHVWGLWRETNHEQQYRTCSACGWKEIRKSIKEEEVA